MKKYIFCLLLSFVAMTCFAQTKAEKDAAKLKAKQEKKEKRAAADFVEGKVPGHIYVFACSSEFGDSLVYITDIIEVDSLTLTKKSKFLPYRSDFSLQFKDKLESSAYKLKNQTSSVFFSDKKEKLQKVLVKLKKHYLTKSQMSIVSIKESEFRFVHPIDYYGITDN